MNKYVTLTKILLKSGNGSLSGDKKKKFKTIALSIVIIVAFIPTIMLFVDFIKKAYDALYSINQQGLILSTGIAFASVIIFFFGIFYSLNVLYFSKDIENLLPLPLKPWHIIAGKFSIVLFYEYITEIIIALPLFMIYGIKGHMNFMYYIYAIILFLTIPVVPLCVASILNIVVMRFTNIGKYKDKLKIIGGIAVMFLAIYFNIWIQKLQSSFMNGQQMLKMLAEGNNSLVNISDKVFLGSSVAAKSLIFSSSFLGFKNMITFLIIVLVMFLIFLFLGEKLYFKGVVGISETFSQRKELNSKDIVKLSRKKSPIKSVMGRELKILFRTPVYFINCVIINFLWPAFLLIPIFTQPQIFKDINKIIFLVNDPKFKGLIPVISLATGIFIASSNLITSTAISREGQNLFVSKYIPISYGTQLMAKVLCGVIMSMVGIIVILILAFALIKLPIYLILMALAASLLGVLFSSMVGIIIDLNFPKLNWDSETKAVKQNLNGCIAMFIGVAVAAILVFSVIKFKGDKFIINIFIFLVILVLDCGLYKFIMTKGVDLFKNIEV